MPRAVPLAILAALLSALAPAPGHAEPDDRWAGIEVGAKGVKAVIVSSANREDAPSVKFVKPDLKTTVNTSLVSGMTKGPDGKDVFREELVEYTAEAVAELHKLLTDPAGPHKLPPARVLVVGSSGVPEAANRADLAKRIKAATGKDIEFIRTADEVALTIRGVIPKEFRDNSVLIDVGSGNTKCGHFQEGSDTRLKEFKVMREPLPGISKLKDEVLKSAKEGTPFDEAITAARKRFAQAVDRHCDAQPGFDNRKRVYLTGGAVWAMVTLTHPERDVDRFYVTVKPEDLVAFNRLLRTGPDFPDPPVPPGLPGAVRERLKQEIKDVRETFTREQLLAGSEILLGFSDGLKLDRGKKEIFFARGGVVAWLLAYVEQNAR